MIFLISFISLFAQATSFIERPFPETVGDSPVIVRGKVGAHFADWANGEDGVRRIYTYYDLQIDEVFRGKVQGSSLKVRELGGEKDGIGMQVAGSAHFIQGEDVVVLLSDLNSDGSHDLRGLMMGKYSVNKDEAGREYLSGAGIQSSSESSNPDEEMEGQTVSSRQKIWTLEALRRLIQSQDLRRPPLKVESRSPKAGQPVDTPQASQLQHLEPDPAGRSTPWEEGKRSVQQGFGSRYRVILGLAALGVLVLIKVVLRRKD